MAWFYLHGFASGPGSTKGVRLAESFGARGRPLERLELTPGPEGFERSTPSSMRGVVQGALSRERGPHAVIGSSLGGYLAAWEASANPAIERLVLLAPAFDPAAIWARRGTPGQHAQWRREGLDTLHYASGATRHLGPGFFQELARLEPWPRVSVPTLVFAGRNDDTVPLAFVERWCAMTPSARLVVLDDGHELIESLETITAASWTFLAQ